MALKPLVELGVDEAYQLLTERFGVVNLPPLLAIENEDWGRDLLLARFLDWTPKQLAEVGFTFDDEPTV